MAAWISQLSAFNKSAFQNVTGSTIAFTTASALAVDDLFIIWHASAGTAARVHSTPVWTAGTSYGTWTQIGTTATGGTNALSAWYCFITTAMPSGVSITLNQTGNTTYQGYSTTAFRNVSKTSTFTLPTSSSYGGTMTSFSPSWLAVMASSGTFYSAKNSVITSALIQNQVSNTITLSGHAVGNTTTDVDVQKALVGMNISGTLSPTQVMTNIYQEVSNNSTDTITAGSSIFTLASGATFAGIVFSMKPAAYPQGNFLPVLT